MRKLASLIASVAVTATLASAPAVMAEPVTDVDHAGVNCTKTINGMPIKPYSAMTTWSAGGVTFHTAPGEPTRVLRDFTTWFVKNIEPIAGGGDDYSWVEPRLGRFSKKCSNHSSGTAVDLNATKHPQYKRTFSGSQASKIRSKVRSYGGHLFWGGDWKNDIDEMHFEYIP